MKKDQILNGISSKTVLSYSGVEDIYKMTKSYDAIIELDRIARTYNKDVFAVAAFLYGQENER